jgi:hypothetical protein
MNLAVYQENIVRPAPVVMTDVCPAIPVILGRIVNATHGFQIQMTALTTLPIIRPQILTM